MKDETEMPESYLRALGKYLQALARHDDDLQGITRVLLDARFCWPSTFNDEVFTEAIARLSALQTEVKAGTEPSLDDWGITEAEAKFEQAMRVSLFNTENTPKATKQAENDT